MAESKLVTVAADGSATTKDAVVGDIFTTVISTTEAVTGMYGLAQKAGLVVLGMGIQNKRVGGSLNPFGA